MAEVIGPVDGRAALDQRRGHVLVAPDVLAVAVREHDDARRRLVGPDPHADLSLAAPQRGPGPSMGGILRVVLDASRTAPARPPGVAQGECRSSQVGERVEDDPGEPRGNQLAQVGRSPRPRSRSRPAYIRRAERDVVDPGRQVAVPVGQNAGELVQPEQDRGREHHSQQQVGLVAGLGQAVSRRGCTEVCVRVRSYRCWRRPRAETYDVRTRAERSQGLDGDLYRRRWTRTGASGSTPCATRVRVRGGGRRLRPAAARRLIKSSRRAFRTCAAGRSRTSPPRAPTTRWSRCWRSSTTSAARAVTTWAYKFALLEGGASRR